MLRRHSAYPSKFRWTAPEVCVEPFFICRQPNITTLNKLAIEGSRLSRDAEKFHLGLV
jgi:hypothetical protein